MTTVVPAPVLAELAAALPPRQLLTDPDVVRTFLHDEAEWAPYGEAIAVAGRRPRRRSPRSWRCARGTACRS